MENGKINAMLVLHHLAERPEFEGKAALVDEIKQAKDALQEVIDAAKLALPRKQHNDSPFDARLRAALAAVGA